MSHFAILWKARTIEKYRQKYESEKINSIIKSNAEIPDKTMFQRWRHYSHHLQTRLSRTFSQWYPEGSTVSKFYTSFRSDNMRLPNILLRSLYGFIVGIFLTYLGFMFFVFQLSISLIHATVLSSILGILLTLGLTFSNSMRCLIFLLIPQLFSRVGRYTLTCYALVLILTGPATNTLKNSEILSESMACTQEHLKTSVSQLNESIKKPYNSIQQSLKITIHNMKLVVAKLKAAMIRINRLLISVASVTQAGFSWLDSVAKNCNEYLGTPEETCLNAMKSTQTNENTVRNKKAETYNNGKEKNKGKLKNSKWFKLLRRVIPGFNKEYTINKVERDIKDTVKVGNNHWFKFLHRKNDNKDEKKIKYPRRYLPEYIVENNNNKDEKVKQDIENAYRDTIAEVVCGSLKVYDKYCVVADFVDESYLTTSFRLVASEKHHLNRTAIFMTVTTFKLLIHIIADYSLYWVLTIIRDYGNRMPLCSPSSESTAFITGSGFVSSLLQSFIDCLDVNLSFAPPEICLPNPHPPDFKRYCQIGFLIFLLWFFVIFEPYGLRIRHIIMGHYRPKRAQTRAVWLYNHILRTRASFMKFARRKLHREYKYSSDFLTLGQWLKSLIPYSWQKTLLCMKRDNPHCLLCNIPEKAFDGYTALIKCQVPKCPGTYCKSCFGDIGELCTICLDPADYGDISDVSFERESSDDDDDCDDNFGGRHNIRRNNNYRTDTLNDRTSKRSKGKEKQLFKMYEKGAKEENLPLLQRYTKNSDTNIITKSVALQIMIKTKKLNEKLIPPKSPNYLKQDSNNYERFKDENNYNHTTKGKQGTFYAVNYSAYEIKLTKVVSIVRTQNVTLLAKYLRKKGIIRRRTKKVVKKRKKINIKRKKQRNRYIKIEVRIHKILNKRKHKERNDVQFFMTCSSARNETKDGELVKQSDNIENNNYNEYQQPVYFKSDKNDYIIGDNDDLTPKKKSKNGSTNRKCACIRRFHNAIAKYCNSNSILKNKTNLNLSPNQEKKHKRKKKHCIEFSRNKSKNLKEPPNNSRLLAYLDEKNWFKSCFENNTLDAKKENGNIATTVNLNQGKDVNLIHNTEDADFEIVNNIKIPRLNLRPITESANGEDKTIEEIMSKDIPRTNIKQNSKSITRLYASPSEIRENERVLRRDFSRSSGFSLSRPLSLLRNIYSSLLLRLNYVDEQDAVKNIKQTVKTVNKEIAAFPETRSCACQYDSHFNKNPIKIFNDCSTQVDLIENKPVLVDANIGSEKSMCTCATQYQKTNVSIGTNFRNHSNVEINKTQSPSGTSETDTTETKLYNYCKYKRHHKYQHKMNQNRSTSTDLNKDNTITDWWSPITDERNLNKYKTNTKYSNNDTDRKDTKKIEVQIEQKKCNSYKNGGRSDTKRTPRIVTFNSRANIIPRGVMWQRAS